MAPSALPERRVNGTPFQRAVSTSISISISISARVSVLRDASTPPSDWYDGSSRPSIVPSV
jgi:hypothetical protein